MAQPQILNIADFQNNAPIVAAVLGAAFRRSHIVTEQGYQGRVRVKVIGPEFNDLPEDEKQNMVWDVLRRQLNEGAQAVSFVVVYGDDEL